jgi:crossover junction endodeoxyribonuclease RuvC
MKILGIDPGSAVTGFGVITAGSGDLVMVAAGALKMSRGEVLSRRLREAADGVRRILDEHAPDEVCLENVFQHVNVRSALVLAHLRGALMLELERAEVPVREYSAVEVKKALVGHGHADKEQVRAMVKRVLRLSDLPRPHDVSDALAVAICHAHAEPIRKRWSGA